MKHKTIEERINILKRLLEIQCSEGTWNYDEYQFGMANGMIFALAVMEDTAEVDYLDAPEMFIKDLELLDKFNESPIIVSKPTSE